MMKWNQEGNIEWNAEMGVIVNSEFGMRKWELIRSTLRLSIGCERSELSSMR